MPEQGPTATIDRPLHRATTALRLEQWGRFCAIAASLIGLAVLIGYATRSASIVKLSPGLPPMYPNAAVGLLAAGVAVMTSRRRGWWRHVTAACALLLGGIGAVGLWLNVGRYDRTWFEALFPRDFVAATTPVGGRPVAETCVAFVLLAGALGCLATRRRPVVGQVLGVAGLAVGLSAVVGYLLGVDRTSLGASLVYVGMALHTGLGIALVGGAVVLVRPDVGIVAQLLDGGAVGAVTRRTTLVVGAAPLVLAAVGALLARTLPTPELSQSVFSVLQVAVLGAAVLIPAALLAGTERQLRAQLEAARRRDEHGDEVNTVIEAITREMVIVTPDVPGWEIGMRYQPATGHLAGDSVQVHRRRHPAPATLIAIIDIAGHDAYAAVVAYGLRAHIGALWEHGTSLAEIATSANTKIFRRHTIATGVLIAIEHGSRDVHVVNAGHPPPTHLRTGTSTTWGRTGPLFGIEHAEHVVRTYTVEPGDLIVAYTDGVIEARSGAGEQLGETTLHRVVRMYRDRPTDEIAAACVDAAVQHAGTRLDDDALVVVLRA